MAKLAIKGHPTRGNEVIDILEMLGGSNPHKYSADCDSLCFCIGKSTNTIYYEWVYDCYGDEDILIFTLEEFLEKFPYKIGDKVQHKGATSCGSVFEIEKIQWVDNDVKYTVKCLWNNNGHTTFTAKGLQPYKEETMEELIIDTIKESADRYRIKVNYQFDIEVDEGEYYAVRRKPQYPKTYEECCKVLDMLSDWHLTFELNNATSRDLCVKNGFYYICRLEALRKLLICRDAYWKIAGDQMGLGKPWKPDWLNVEQDKFVLYTHDDVICLNRFVLGHNVLAFPTAEIRDAFLDNFKELIESCKELL